MARPCSDGRGRGRGHNGEPTTVKARSCHAAHRPRNRGNGSPAGVGQGSSGERRALTRHLGEADQIVFRLPPRPRRWRRSLRQWHSAGAALARPAERLEQHPEPFHQHLEGLDQHLERFEVLSKAFAQHLRAFQVLFEPFAQHLGALEVLFEGFEQSLERFRRRLAGRAKRARVAGVTDPPLPGPNLADSLCRTPLARKSHSTCADPNGAAAITRPHHLETRDVQQR